MTSHGNSSVAAACSQDGMASVPTILEKNQAPIDKEAPAIDSSDISDHGSIFERDSRIDDRHTSDTEDDSDNEGLDSGILSDDSFSESDSSSTTSLTSAAEEYFWLYGRPYPNRSMGYSCNKSVLDIGTGTGIWPIQFGDKNPGIKVVGTDISPIQPDWVPPNVEFQMEDCDRLWTFPESSFHFIRAWGLNGCVNRYSFTKEAFKTAAPGGVVEFGEVCVGLCSSNGTLADKCHMKEWEDFFQQAGNKRGKPFMVTDDETLRRAMEDAGFNDVKEHKYKIPIGTWHEAKEDVESAHIDLEVFHSDIKGEMLRLAIEELDWDESKISTFASELRQEMQLRCEEDEIYALLIVVVGKKPEHPVT
ncbi:methyltransferase [Fusarium heterosporum]|uniref:Methyltransferase n=1 Tax=Fusarium heterosporum TaxID=42747 RepID=A0A8H5TTM1_FUSHE|nr:methyltransferase [Fusarium heterosporum]